MNLTGKTVLITGAKGGLGTFVTKAFLQAGAYVIGVSRSIADSDFEHESFRAIPAELSSLTGAQKVVEQALRIDVLIHLLGGFAGGQSVEQTEDATFDRMFDLNLRSAFHIVRAVLPGMRTRKAGRILAIGSRAATEPSPGSAAYAASKAALVSLIRSIAAENQDRCITANMVLPGTMDTPQNRSANPDADYSKWVHPCQVASMLVHLASDGASQVNGALIPIFGGEAG
jgi:NAD(P)-dependent dehydrogenase (short-subunit alcohol dehydrogenase family)